MMRRALRPLTAIALMALCSCASQRSLKDRLAGENPKITLSALSVSATHLDH